jgi:hypothetical protein
VAKTSGAGTNVAGTIGAGTIGAGTTVASTKHSPAVLWLLPYAPRLALQRFMRLVSILIWG